jgi:threonine dehydratase
LGSATLDFSDIERLRTWLGRWVLKTPVLDSPYLAERSGAKAVHAKLEFLQRTGTFKPRGALSVMSQLDQRQLERGITAVSAGNHAIAAAYAAAQMGSSAKVVMIPSANPYRVDLCKRYGAEVLMAESVHQAFELAEQIREQEGRYFVHPFEGLHTIMGTATLGMEIAEQVAGFDLVVVPIGGGGLCAGVSAAIKQANPGCEVIGVEPVGADSMLRSFRSGHPEKLESVNTVADSLGAPFALPISFGFCYANVDRIVTVTDEEMRRTMGMLFVEQKIAVEPACAASTAALLGPLAESARGRRVVLVMCGSNIDWRSFERLALFD